jgi:ATP-binding cassette subfamily C protein
VSPPAKSTPAWRELGAVLTPRERRRAALLAAAAVGGAFAEALGIGAVFPFMGLIGNPALALEDARLRPLYEWSGAGGPDRFLALSAIALMALFVAKNLFLGALYAFQARFVFDVEVRLGTSLFDAYLRAPYVARLARHSADHVRVVTTEVGRVSAGLLLPAIGLATELLVVAALLALLFWVHPQAALLAVAVVAAAGGAMQLLARRALARARALQARAVQGKFRWAKESIGALKEIKVLGRESFFVERFASHGTAYARAMRSFTVMNQVPRLAVETALVVALLAAILVGLRSGGAAHALMPLLTLFGLAAVRIMPSAARIVAAANSLHYYAGSVREVAADLRLAVAEPAPRGEGESASHAREPLRLLELERVSFRYPGSAAPSLHEVSLRVAPGELVAVVGRSGAGKTTLADLLLGLLEPTGGEIRINRRPALSAGRGRDGLAGLVPQHFFLLDDTVRRNVAFGLPDGRIDDARVRRALHAAQLDAKIRDLPAGLDARIGEQGLALSGGERQRLSIARALYESPDLLVLDEPTSALDAETEAGILRTLRALAAEKAVVLVTHRVAAASACDRVVVLDGGRITYDGPSAGVALEAAPAGSSPSPA